MDQIDTSWLWVSAQAGYGCEPKQVMGMSPNRQVMDLGDLDAEAPEPDQQDRRLLHAPDSRCILDFSA